MSVVGGHSQVLQDLHRRHLPAPDDRARAREAGFVRLVLLALLGPELEHVLRSALAFRLAAHRIVATLLSGLNPKLGACLRTASAT